jgi:transcriptional regulator with GAF, ATPase, and Fis domain
MFASSPAEMLTAAKRARTACYARFQEGRMPGESIGDLKKWVSELVRKSEGDAVGMNRVVDLISKQFGVQHHEVAIFVLTTDGKFLRFVVPEKLHSVGQIPTTSTTSLVARTAREKRPEVINHFSVVPHASVFEAVPLVEEQRGDPIQKIMSAPVMHEKKVIGVMQISRKGKTSAESGPDFTQAQLRELRTVAEIVAPCLPLCIQE